MQKMTSRERLWAAVRGEPVDTIPVAPRIWRYAKSVDASIVELAKQYDFEVSQCGGGYITAIHDVYGRSGADWPEAQVDVRTTREERMTRIERTIRTPGGALHDVLMQPDAGVEFGISPNPEWHEPLVKTRADAELLPYLFPDPRRLRPRFADVRRLEAEVGAAGFVAIRPTIGPDHMTVDALGVEQALVASLADPALLARVLELTDGWHTRVMELMLEDGFRLIFDPLYNFSLSVGWSPTFYRETVMPMLRRHADLIHRCGGTLFFYDDGKMAQSVEYMVAAGADIIETLTPVPAGDIVYADLARAHGGKACFKGGIDTVRIRFGTPAEIDRTVRDAVAALGPTRRFILSASDSITEGTPEANVRAFFAASRTYGREMARQLYA